MRLSNMTFSPCPKVRITHFLNSNLTVYTYLLVYMWISLEDRPFSLNRLSVVVSAMLIKRSILTADQPQLRIHHNNTKASSYAIPKTKRITHKGCKKKKKRSYGSSDSSLSPPKSRFHRQSTTPPFPSPSTTPCICSPFLPRDHQPVPQSPIMLKQLCRQKRQKIAKPRCGFSVRFFGSRSADHFVSAMSHGRGPGEDRQGLSYSGIEEN